MNNQTIENDPQFPQWFADFRQQHWDHFLKQGLPSAKEERFKYTDFSFLNHLHLTRAPSVDFEKMKLSRSSIQQALSDYRLKKSDSILLAFLNGKFAPQLSECHKLPKETLALPFATALLTYPELIKKFLQRNIPWHDYPFARLNAAQFIDGFFFLLPNDCHLDLPLHFLSLNTQENLSEHHCHMIALGERSKATIVDEFRSLNNQVNMINVVRHVMLDPLANLSYYKILKDSDNAIHMAHSFIHQEKSSEMTSTNISMNYQFAREDLLFQLQAEGAKCAARGLYFTRHHQQYVDQHVDIYHAKPHSQSEMLYKGILDKKSRAVFNGKLNVLPQAQKILAHQANHNLLLSQQSELYSKPELEIYADDVKCTHGATVGQLDPQSLFYLRSRGLDEGSAKQMLLRGFVDEILQCISHDSIKQHILSMVSHDSFS